MTNKGEASRVYNGTMTIGTTAILAAVGVCATLGLIEGAYALDRHLRMRARDRAFARLREIQAGARMTDLDERDRLLAYVVRCCLPRIGPGARADLARFDVESRIAARKRRADRQAAAGLPGGWLPAGWHHVQTGGQ